MPRRSPVPHHAGRSRARPLAEHPAMQQRGERVDGRRVGCAHIPIGGSSKSNGTQSALAATRCTATMQRSNASHIIVALSLCGVVCVLRARAHVGLFVFLSLRSESNKFNFLFA